MFSRYLFDTIVVDDHGDDISSSSRIYKNGGNCVGSIEESGDEDFFWVALSSAGTLTVYTTGSTDTYGYLLDSNGNELIKSDDDGDGRNFSLSWNVSAGTYYVRVRGYNSSVGNYVLRTSFD